MLEPRVCRIVGAGNGFSWRWFQLAMVSSGDHLELVIVKSLDRLELAIVGAWRLLDFVIVGAGNRLELADCAVGVVSSGRRR